MTSETKPGDKPGDPADRAADGAFGGVTPHATHSHRAGYGDDKLARLIGWLRAHPTTTLASGEGTLLLAEIDRLRAAAKDSADHYADARDEIDRLRVAFKIERANTLRLERILNALREPSATIVDETWNAFDEYDGEMSGLIRHTIRAAVSAAVAAAEQEVGRE